MRITKGIQTRRLFLVSQLILVACLVSVNAATVQNTATTSVTLPIDLTSYSNSSSFINGTYDLYWSVDKDAPVIYFAADVKTSSGLVIVIIFSIHLTLHPLIAN